MPLLKQKLQQTHCEFMDFFVPWGAGGEKQTLLFEFSNIHIGTVRSFQIWWTLKLML